MTWNAPVEAPSTTRGVRRFKAVTKRDLATSSPFKHLAPELLRSLQVMAEILPFKANRYVVDELIDWEKVPDDPIFQLTFPNRAMVPEETYACMDDVLRSDPDAETLKMVGIILRNGLIPRQPETGESPLPAHDGKEIPGLYRQFRETLLVFPRRAQTCFANCTYCIRWMKQTKEAPASYCTDERSALPYLRDHPEISDVLLTGGDPLVMRAQVLRKYIAPLLDLEGVRTIRISTRAIAWWPYRFSGDKDADELLRLFEEIVEAGRHLCIIGHISHPRELQTRAAVRAVSRIRSTGAVIRCQGPLLGHVNDDVDTLAELWRREVSLGMVPYYLFLDSDAGPRDYFKVPLSRAVDLFQAAQRRSSGLARTVRGPVAYNVTDKVLINDVVDLNGEKRFVLQYIQSNQPDKAGRVFFARFDERATRYDQLDILSNR